MDNYIIELRNKDVVDKLRVENSVLQEGAVNGVWSTNLSAGNNLVLENGDTLICRNSYIDTKAESEGKIVIVEDTPITVKYNYYANNWNGNAREYISNSTWRTTNTSIKTPINATDNKVIAQSDGKMYIACDVTDSGSDYRFQKSLTYVGQNALQHVGGFNVYIRYNDVNGNIATKLVELPKYFEVGWGTDSQLDINVTYKATPPFPLGQTSAIACFLPNTSSTNPEPDLQLRMDGTNFEYQDTVINALTDPTVLQGKLYTPKVGFSEFTLPAGNYTPAELCETINDEMTKSKGEPTLANLTNNQLLVPIGGADGNGDIPNTAFNNFIRVQGEGDDTVDGYGFKYTEGVNAPSILGASQFVMSYDDDTSKFNFQYLHTPIYSNADGSDGNDGIKGGYGSAKGWTGDQENQPNPNLPTNNYKIAKNGGILLTDLQPASLWQDQLGFDLQRFQRDQTGKPTNIPNPNCVLVGQTQAAKNSQGQDYTTNGLQTSIPLFYNLPKNGVNMTEGFVGVNTTFLKSAKFQQQIQLAPPAGASGLAGTAQTTFTLIGTDTEDITAGKSVLATDNTRTTFGYFLIEVQGNFVNNYLNENGNFRHIMSIVSRYYSKENYTSSTAADSIVYTHKGDPITLNSFNCRILNSAKQVAENIGEDNTVILELVKAPKTPLSDKNK